jgi:hypothetical protein
MMLRLTHNLCSARFSSCKDCLKYARSLMAQELHKHPAFLEFTSGRWYDGYRTDRRWVPCRTKLGLPP